MLKTRSPLGAFGSISNPTQTSSRCPNMASNVFLQPYNDVPGIDLAEDSPLINDNRTFPRSLGALDVYWNRAGTSTRDLTSVLGYPPDKTTAGECLWLLDRQAIGEVLPFYSDLTGEKPFQPSYHQPWEPHDIYPHLDHTVRYIAPGGLLGGDLDPESSQSECSWSSQSSRDIPKPFDSRHEYSQGLHSPPADSSCGNDFGHNWSASYFSTPSVRAALPRHHSVALKELQHYPDSEPDDCFYDKDPIKFKGACSQTTELLIDHADFHDEALGDSVDGDHAFEDEGCNEDGHSEYSPSKCDRWTSQRNRLTPKQPTGHKQHSRTVKTQRSRVSKSTHSKIRSRGYQDASVTTNAGRKKHLKEGKIPTRSYVCSFSHYGCNSSFGSKNEWKRHVMSQHLQLGFYRCDVGSCVPEHGGTKASNPNARVHNDFNRKDLFTQHQRRMHCPWSPPAKPPCAQQKESFEDSLETVRQRCWRQRRNAPEKSVCGFCSRVFEGLSTWDERMEHVGKHFEKGDGEETEDEELRRWALQEEIITPLGHGQFRLVGKNAIPSEPGDEDAEGEDE